MEAKKDSREKDRRKEDSREEYREKKTKNTAQRKFSPRYSLFCCFILIC